MTTTSESMLKIGPFLDPLSDFGFKKIFFEEATKPYLLNFLNALLFADKPESKIHEIELLPTEELPNTSGERKIIFDLKCKTESGEFIIVEMQRAEQEFFKHRSFFYGCSTVVNQAKKGKWNFFFNKVYVVSILNFTLENSTQVVSHFRYSCENNKNVDMDLLSLSFVELPQFNKELSECESELEEWLYVIRNMSSVDDIPEALKKDEKWLHFFELVNIPNFSTPEYKSYLSELKYFSQIESAKQLAVNRAIAEKDDLVQELQKEKEEAQQKEAEAQQKVKDLAKMLVSLDVPIEQIIEKTGLTKAEILGLKMQ